MIKNLPASEGNTGLIPGLERSPGEGNSNLFQYPCLGNPMDRGAWWAIIHGASKELDTTYRLKTTAFFFAFVQGALERKFRFCSAVFLDVLCLFLASVQTRLH